VFLPFWDQHAFAILAPHVAVVWAILDRFVNGCSGRHHHRTILELAGQAKRLENDSEELVRRRTLSVEGDSERGAQSLTSLAECG
jgi:hypothetical protein